MLKQFKKLLSRGFANISDWCETLSITLDDDAMEGFRTALDDLRNGRVSPYTPLKQSSESRVLSEAEKHWAYTREALRLGGVSQDVLTLCEYLYVQAMKHGYRHGLKREWEHPEEVK